MKHDPQEDCFTSSSTSSSSVEEIPAEITPLVNHHHQNNCYTTLTVFPDSGASICLAGQTHVRKLGLDTNNLIKATVKSLKKKRPYTANFHDLSKKRKKRKKRNFI